MSALDTGAPIGSRSYGDGWGKDMKIPPEPEKPAAWRCEHCHKLIPATIASEVILVDEASSSWYGSTVKRKARFLRRMVACPPCRRKIADQEGGQS